MKAQQSECVRPGGRPVWAVENLVETLRQGELGQGRGPGAARPSGLSQQCRGEPFSLTRHAEVLPLEGSAGGRMNCMAERPELPELGGQKPV